MRFTASAREILPSSAPKNLDNCSEIGHGARNPIFLPLPPTVFSVFCFLDFGSASSVSMSLSLLLAAQRKEKKSSGHSILT